MNFEVGTRGESFAVHENRWNASVSSLAWEASLTSQAQTTPAWIAFRFTKTIRAGVVGSGLLKAVRAGVWLPRLRERLPRLHCSTKTFLRVVLKNSYNDNKRLVTVLIRLLSRLAYFRLFHVEREVLGLLVLKFSWVENFVTPGWTTNITKISTHRNNRLYGIMLRVKETKEIRGR